MFPLSNVRLLLRCPICAECAEIDREQHLTAETFCSLDNVPMTVIAVAAGSFRDGVMWPEHCPCRNSGQPKVVPLPASRSGAVMVRFVPRPRRELEMIGA